MRLLLDTQLLLWALVEPGRLDRMTRDIVEDPGNTVLFSVASIWEVAIKSALGRDDFRFRPDVIARAARETGFVELPIGSSAAAGVADLPLHHRDPFDRLLVAQAMTEPAFLYTTDPALNPYTDLVRLVVPRPA